MLTLKLLAALVLDLARREKSPLLRIVAEDIGCRGWKKSGGREPSDCTVTASGRDIRGRRGGGGREEGSAIVKSSAGLRRRKEGSGRNWLHRRH